MPGDPVQAVAAEEGPDSSSSSTGGGGGGGVSLSFLRAADRFIAHRKEGSAGGTGGGYGEANAVLLGPAAVTAGSGGRVADGNAYTGGRDALRDGGGGLPSAWSLYKTQAEIGRIVSWLDAQDPEERMLRKVCAQQLIRYCLSLIVLIPGVIEPKPFVRNLSTLDFSGFAASVP